MLLLSHQKSRLFVYSSMDWWSKSENYSFYSSSNSSAIFGYFCRSCGWQKSFLHSVISKNVQYAWVCIGQKNLLYLIVFNELVEKLDIEVTCMQFTYLEFLGDTYSLYFFFLKQEKFLNHADNFGMCMCSQVEIKFIGGIELKIFLKGSFQKI